MFWDDWPSKLVAEYRNNGAYLKSHPFVKVYGGAKVDSLINAVKKDPWIEKVADPDIGHVKTHMGMSQSTMRSLLYIREMENYFDPYSIEWMTDFGPGWGNNVRIWHKLFETKYFQICDIPALHEITQGYLSKCGIHANWYDYKSMRKPIGKSLFFASHSLNETPLHVRERVEEELPHYDCIYISYNDNFDDINNIEYFEQLANRLPHKTEIIFDSVTGKRRLIGTK